MDLQGGVSRRRDRGEHRALTAIASLARRLMGYLPVHFGSRFSKNAFTPSWMSSVENAIVSCGAQEVERLDERHVVLAEHRVLAEPHHHRRLAGELARPSRAPRPRTPSAGTTRLTIPIRSASCGRDLLAEQQQLVGLLARDVAVDQRHDHEREQPDVDLRACRTAPPRARSSGRTRARSRARRRARARWRRRSTACRARRAAGTGAGTARWRSACGRAARRPRSRPRLAPAENTRSCVEVSTTQRTAVVVARGLERRDQLVEQLVGQRVARLGLVERDRRDAGVGDVVAEGRVGHRAEAYADRGLRERR